MSLDRMIKKAYELICDRRIEQISDDTYNVIGMHGTYTVVKGSDGSITCSCPGFLTKKKCSHSLAVMMLMQPRLLAGVKREIEREERKAKR
ncbi:MAG: SWIM zinc finger family protein [Candidatus Bathyarchaeia archaeon]